MVKLSEEDRKNLVDLYTTAETTPVLYLSGRPPSAADLAWDAVRNFMDELGKKYSFNPAQMKGIDKETGEISL